MFIKCPVISQWRGSSRNHNFSGISIYSLAYWGGIYVSLNLNMLHIKRCPGCQMPQTEQAFGPLHKDCAGDWPGPKGPGALIRRRPLWTVTPLSFDHVSYSVFGIVRNLFYWELIFCVFCYSYSEIRLNGIVPKERTHSVYGASVQ